MKKLFSILVIAALGLTVLYGCNTYTASAEENYVGIDMSEAGVQFVVDGNNEVLAFSATTLEGEEVIMDEDYIGEDVDDAINDVIENGVEQGYVDPEATEEDPNDVLVTTDCSNPKARQQWKEQMMNAVDQAFQDNGVWAMILGAEDIEEINALAEQYGLTAAQVRIVMALQLNNPELTFEEAADKSPSWFMAMLRAGKPVKAQITALTEQKATLEAELATLNETENAERIAEINTELEGINAKLQSLEAAKNQIQTFKEANKAAHQAAMNQWKIMKQTRAQQIKGRRGDNGNCFSTETRTQKKAEVGNRFQGNRG